MADDDEVQRLRLENARLERRVRQLQRTVATTDEMRERSQRVTNRIRADLEDQVRVQAATEVELRAAKDKAEAVARSKARFVAVMSHELRTPLNGLVGATDLLLQIATDPEQRELATVAGCAARALGEIVNDVLDHAALEENAVTINNRELNLHAVLRETTSLHRLSAVGRDLVVQCDIADDLPESVLGDEQRIRQVLNNLVHNALKFTDRGAVTLSGAAGPDGTVVLSVQDTGIGIAEDAIERLFAPFEQADQSTSRRFGGSGLGLTICNRLVERMGGTIAVCSQLGVGTTFTVTLPLAPAARTTPVRPVDHGRQFDATVLVVDDNPANLTLTRLMLQRFGCRVLIAGDGEEGIRVLEGADVDLVLMDAEMPRLDGYATTARIRRLAPPKGKVPVVCLTAHVLSDAVFSAAAAGMNGHLPKPLRLDALEAALHAYVGVPSA